MIADLTQRLATTLIEDQETATASRRSGRAAADGHLSIVARERSHARSLSVADLLAPAVEQHGQRLRAN